MSGTFLFSQVTMDGLARSCNYFSSYLLHRLAADQLATVTAALTLGPENALI